ncbi:hypothetical protein [Tenuibacillus multivorans]|uniref:Uncharacterized protein n=1 Tax=Tenuibacillus multivorans TaxID=237069 RepID=A0A1H0ELC4_9BACI|nr:hypothetical protein [Tenuibacillus multivorans]GEL77112.1 hypothetical protein TMU01_13470 [Tenuibacillus multivorans]SDN83106.1 hypothetical protein SAMN05216498_3198 [Tenuibacillus multivorans]
MSRFSQDPIQLQQQLIHVKAELDKYKKHLKAYKHSFRYSNINHLKDENKQLQKQIDELNGTLADLEDQLDDNKNQLSVSRIKTYMYQSALEHIEQEQQQLLQEKHELISKQNAQQKRVENNKSTIKQQSYQLNQLKEAKEQQLFEIKTLEDTIRVLRMENSDLREHEVLLRKTFISQLTNTLKKISVNGKEHSQHIVKFDLIHQLEHKLSQLEEEIKQIELK